MDQATAFADGLAYVDANNTVIMKGDDTTTLPAGVNRNRCVILTRLLAISLFINWLFFKSVRIQSNTTYTGGLFILDINQAPWGCGMQPYLCLSMVYLDVLSGVWPAFWTVGNDWPNVRFRPA